MSSDPDLGDRVPARLILFGSLLVAFLLRAEYMRELILSPFGRHLLLDAQWYDQAARVLMAGGSIAEGTAYFRPPLYPLFVAGIYSLFHDGVWAVRAVQWGLGIVNVALCWAIAIRTHGRTVLGVPRVDGRRQPNRRAPAPVSLRRDIQVEIPDFLTLRRKVESLPIGRDSRRVIGLRRVDLWPEIDRILPAGIGIIAICDVEIEAALRFLIAWR